MMDDEQLTSSSGSSSSSSSGEDSLYGSGALGASRWNRLRAARPLRPRSEGGGGSGDGDEDDEVAILVAKRRYPAPTYPPPSPDVGSSEAGEEKTEIERAVLVDCLSHHFLWGHLPQSELERICASFAKCSYRDHEVIYSEGDAAAYLYILYSGEVDYKSKEGETYTVLGELALLKHGLYTETVHATSKCTLFRQDRAAFHRSLRPPPIVGVDERLALLKSAIPDDIMEQNYFTEADLQELASVMEAHRFEAGEVLVKKKERLDALVIISEGCAVAKEITLGGRSYEDKVFGPEAPSMAFGWQSLLTSTASDRPHFEGRIVGQTDGVAIKLTSKSFTEVMRSHHRGFASGLEHMAARRLARLEIQQIPLFEDSSLDDAQINGLLALLHRCEYTARDVETTKIFRAGEKIEAALYFVREGAVTLEANKGEDVRVIEAGDYFGETQMLRDQNKDGLKSTIFRSPATALAHGPRTAVDVLYLEECRSVIDTTRLGLGNAGASQRETKPSLQWADIERHSLLGTGTFGQVWLATIPSRTRAMGADTKEETADECERQSVALKVMAKHQIVEAGEAGHVVAERNILTTLKSSFLLQLIDAFQDDDLVYMVTTVALGGELESLIPEDGMCEESAKFYAAGVLEGLAAMHRVRLVHRDIKPQNVLLNARGYPVLIDFGFAKYVPDKTFTFVGSPIFTAPEIIRFQGHNKSADYWAWAVLLYRMVVGKYPFFEKGMDELDLYKRICRGTIELDGQMSVDFRTLVTSVLYPNPSQRLGSGRHGWRDIMNLSWFDSLDVKKLRSQKLSAPWIPTFADPLDASSFHPDESEFDDLLRSNFPTVSAKHQLIFATFGPQID